MALQKGGDSRVLREILEFLPQEGPLAEQFRRAVQSYLDAHQGAEHGNSNRPDWEPYIETRQIVVAKVRKFSFDYTNGRKLLLSNPAVFNGKV